MKCYVILKRNDCECCVNVVEVHAAKHSAVSRIEELNSTENGYLSDIIISEIVDTIENKTDSDLDDDYYTISEQLIEELNKRNISHETWIKSWDRFNDIERYYYYLEECELISD